MNPELHRIREVVKEGSNSESSLSTNEILNLKDQLCVPNNEELRNQTLTEAHATLYLVHP